MRKILEALRGAFSWLTKGLYWLSVPPRLLFQPLAALFGAELFTSEEVERGSRFAGRVLAPVGRVAGPALRGTAPIALEASKLAATAPFALAAAPFRAAGALARAVTGGRGAPQSMPSPDQEAAEAREAAVTQQRRADAAEDSRAVMVALRRVAQARASGQHPDPAHLGRLPKQILDYLDSLTADELDALARKPTSELRRVITGGDRDVRSASEALAGRAPVVSSVVDIRDARRAALRDAVRGVRAEREPTADAVLAAAHAAVKQHGRVKT